MSDDGNGRPQNGNGRPQNMVQATGQVANRVVGALGTQPIFLVVVLLNCIMIGSMAWFLGKLETMRHEKFLKVFETLENCVTKPDQEKNQP
jgi:hypothetical protein